MAYTDHSHFDSFPGTSRDRKNITRRAMATDSAAGTAVAASGDVTNAWHDATGFRKVGAIASGATLDVSVHVELDLTGDGTVDETVSGTTGSTSQVATRDMLAQQVRVRVRNEGLSAQDVDGVLLLGD